MVNKKYIANYWIFGVAESTDPILFCGRFTLVPVVTLPNSRTVIAWCSTMTAPSFWPLHPVPMADGGWRRPPAYFFTDVIAAKSRKRSMKAEDEEEEGASRGWRRGWTDVKDDFRGKKHQQGIPGSVRSTQCNLGAEKSQLPCIQHLH